MSDVYAFQKVPCSCDYDAPTQNETRRPLPTIPKDNDGPIPSVINWDDPANATQAEEKQSGSNDFVKNQEIDGPIPPVIEW